MSKLQNKVAVITGGNSGIGFETAQSFVREGARVVIFGRNRETLDQAAASLGDAAVAIQGDVSKLDDLDRLFTEVRERFGRIDVLFVNAGIAQFAPVEETTEELFDRLMGVNVKGAFFTVQKALPLLQEGSSVVLTSSVVAQLGLSAASVYSATKAAVRSLARTLSADLHGRGIRVNTVSPGPIETPIFGRLEMPQAQVQEFGSSVLEQVPMSRMGSAEEVASAVVFLASTDSSYVLGSDLVVDGGMSQL